MQVNKEQLNDSYKFWQDDVQYHKRDARIDSRISSITAALGTAGLALTTSNQIVGVPVALIGFGFSIGFHRAGMHQVDLAITSQRKVDMIEQQLSQITISS